MRDKREFCRHVLNTCRTRVSFRSGSAGEANRRYYVVSEDGQRVRHRAEGLPRRQQHEYFRAAVERPGIHNLGVCTNPGADLKERVVWHPYPPERGIIERQQQVDGVMIWDMVCGKSDAHAEACRRAGASDGRRSLRVAAAVHLRAAGYDCEPAKQSAPVAQSLDDVQLLKAFPTVSRQGHEVIMWILRSSHQGAETMRKTCIRRGGPWSRNLS